MIARADDTGLSPAGIKPHHRGFTPIHDLRSSLRTANLFGSRSPLSKSFKPPVATLVVLNPLHVRDIVTASLGHLRLGSHPCSHYLGSTLCTRILYLCCVVAIPHPSNDFVAMRYVSCAPCTRECLTSPPPFMSLKTRFFAGY